MSGAYVDVNERLVWSRSKLHRTRFSIAVTGLVAGIVIAVLASNGRDYIIGWGSIAVCFPWAFYELYWWRKPDTALIELLPQGVIFRITTEHFIVPWHEIKGIETTNIHTSFRGRPVTFNNVTVLLVSQHFYDRVIHVDNFIMRGPGWDANFIPKDDSTMLIAIHHEILPSVTAETVRREVEERWKVFGKAQLMA